MIFYCCPSLPDYYCDGYEFDVLPVSKVVTVSNDTEHRKRLLPLSKSLTSQQRQSTHKIKYGRYTIIDSTGTNFTCWSTGGDRVKYYLDYQGSIDPGDSLFGTFPDPDWTLDMRLKIKDLKVNLSSSVAEHAQVADTFISLTNVVHRAYKALRKGKFSHVYGEAKLFKTIAASHLLHDYGIKPLAQDLGRFAGAMASQTPPPVVRRFVMTKKGVKLYSFPEHSEYKLKTSKRVILTVEFEPDWAPITIGNPVEWAWELIPFSFVVDWMIPIGDWIQAMDAMKGISQVYGTVTTKREYEHTHWNSALSASSKVPATVEYFDHSREVISSIPYPPLPTYEPSGTIRNVAQGLSLLRLIQDS